MPLSTSIDDNKETAWLETETGSSTEVSGSDGATAGSGGATVTVAGSVDVAVAGSVGVTVAASGSGVQVSATLPDLPLLGKPQTELPGLIAEVLAPVTSGSSLLGSQGKMMAQETISWQNNRKNNGPLPCTHGPKNIKRSYRRRKGQMSSS